MIKRIFDIIFSLIGLLLLSPLFLMIAIFIKIDSKGNILFTQIRVGKNEKLFYIHKFRTMVVNAENLGLKITVGFDSRITRFGNFLRKFKLDELPQLWDILVGNMSFVGPRPEVLEYVNYYPPELKEKIFSVRPGITDYASILMIDESELLLNTVNPREYYINKVLPYKLNYAIKYIDNMNILLDIRLIFLTIIRVFKRK
jgi:lipopolysaccharide/colanic/teichoic acid biosynthesis glycosyltransferase